MRKIIVVSTAGPYWLPDAMFDLNGDGAMDGQDHVTWVKDLKRTWFGDANLNGRFDSRDLVDVFVAGEYEDELPLNSDWQTGDWDADGEFTSADFVVAFQDGGYEQGPRPAVAAVPEPSSIAMMLTAFTLLFRRPLELGR